MRAERPLLQISGGSQDAELAAFEFEGDVLQRDEPLAGLRPGVVKIVQSGGA